jgi:hypothetical protein
VENMDLQKAMKEMMERMEAERKADQEEMLAKMDAN